MSELSKKPPVAYCCPGQKHPISRAVHLARLAAYYPPCRECPHNDDTGSLSPRQVEKLQEVRARGRPRELFHEEGAGGVYRNDLAPTTARRIAAALAATIRAAGTVLGDAKAGTVARPTIILGSDGRAITAEVTAAVAEGLRYGGCDVTDIGLATAGCLAFAVAHFGASAGILVGNPGHEPHSIGLQFWEKGTVPFSPARKSGQSPGPLPVSAAGLEAIAQQYRAGVARPARQFGDLRRAAAAAPYLDAIKQHYHALRPLRVLIDSASRPLIEYLQMLAAKVACQIIPSRVPRHELPRQIRDDAAHFAACVDGDGETCRMMDEQGRAVPTERLLMLLARHVAGAPRAPSAILASEDHSCSSEVPAGVVVEDGISQRAIERLERMGLRVETANPRRAEMAAAMSQHNAVLGGGPTGRFWHRIGELALPDALMSITHLLAVLSRGDEPFSMVLDREAPLD